MIIFKKKLESRWVYGFLLANPVCVPTRHLAFYYVGCVLNVVLAYKGCTSQL